MTQKQELDAAREEIARLKAEALSPRKLSLKVSQKKGVSCYGLGRFPVTLYKSQWNQLLAFVPTIKSFIIEHDSELKNKPDDHVTAKPTPAEPTSASVQNSALASMTRDEVIAALSRFDIEGS